MTVKGDKSIGREARHAAGVKRGQGGRGILAK